MSADHMDKQLSSIDDSMVKKSSSKKSSSNGGKKSANKKAEPEIKSDAEIIKLLMDKKIHFEQRLATAESQLIVFQNEAQVCRKELKLINGYITAASDPKSK